MTTWILTFVVVASVNGHRIEHQHTAANLRGPDHCVSVLRAVGRRLSRGSRIEQARCQESWRT